jgi:hypothetical protein
MVETSLPGQKPGLVKAGSSGRTSGWDIGEANKMELFAVAGVII